MSRTGVVALLVIGIALCLPGIAFSGLDEEPPKPEAAVAGPVAKDIDGDSRRLEIERVIDRRIMQPFPDGNFRPADPVNEESFAKVLERLLIACPNMSKTDFKADKPKQGLSRIRAIMLIVRSAADKLAMESVSDTDSILARYGDTKSIPVWGVKCIAFAVDHGYVEAEPNLRPMDPITRSELAGVLAKCLAPTGAPTAPTTPTQPTDPTDRVVTDGYTGLLVDCRGLGLRRCMSPAITSEGGDNVYPDPKKLPTIEFMEDHGIAGFVTDIANAKRTGSRPLEVKAVRVDGNARNIAVISDSDGETILAEEQKSHFLAGWNVTFLMD
ncbi:MAG: S-layer homology domain-containing protein [Armatimonadetes bacterium]|nr:S-layer homology domain-containing protein [Armatimonadota bacterium]